MKLFLSTLCLGGAAAAASTGAEQEAAVRLAPVQSTAPAASAPASAPIAAVNLTSAARAQDDDDEELEAAAAKLEKELTRLRAELAEMRAKLEGETSGSISVNEEMRRRLGEAKAQAGRTIVEGRRARVEREVARAKERASIEGRIVRQRLAEERERSEQVQAKLRAVEAEVARAREAGDGARAGLLRARIEREAAREALEQARAKLRARLGAQDGDGETIEEIVEVWGERLGDDVQLEIIERRGDGAGAVILEGVEYGDGGATVWRSRGSRADAGERSEATGQRGRVLRGRLAPGAPVPPGAPRAPRPTRSPRAQGAGSGAGGGQTIHINVDEGDVHIHGDGAQIHTSKPGGATSSGGQRQGAPRPRGAHIEQRTLRAGPGGVIRELEAGDGGRFEFRFGTKDDDEREVEEEPEHGFTMKGLPGGGFAVGLGTTFELDDVSELEGFELDLDDLDLDDLEIDIQIDGIDSLVEAGDLFAGPAVIEELQSVITELPRFVVEGEKLGDGDLETRVMVLRTKDGETETLVFKNGELVEGEVPAGQSLPILTDIPFVEGVLNLEDIEECDEIEIDVEVIEELPEVIREGAAPVVLGRLFPGADLAGGPASADDDLIQLAREIRDELRAMRAELRALRSELSSGPAPVAPGSAAGFPGAAPRAPSDAVFAAPIAPDAPAPRAPGFPRAGEAPSAPSAPSAPTGASFGAGSR